MELQQHIAHPHPLVFNQEMNRQSEETSRCFGCNRKVKGPTFSCSDCGFFLHKGCAEAPKEIQHHPFHRDHPLILRQLSSMEEGGGDYCKVCHCYIGKKFSYCCSSCKIAFHLKCSLLQRDTSGNFIEILHRTHKHPLLLIDNQNFLLQYRECSGCSTELVNDSYGCFDCNIFFHKKCVELPIKISHPYHRKHQLILESDFRFCNLCQKKHSGLFYRCSICNLDFHSECFPPPVIEDKKHHEHPFTLLLRPNSFTCDACDTQDDNVSYICSTCNIQVHKDCISSPRFIRLNLHRHPLSHNFFLPIRSHDSRTWDCRLCYKKVNTEHGSYCCSRPNCDFVIHVKCATNEDNKKWYDIIELEDLDEIKEIDESQNLIIRVLQEIKVGDNVIAAEIIHSSHEQHSLTFNDEINDNKNCNGCLMPIFSSFYYCSCCDFFLHKACAELPRRTLLWISENPFKLLTDGIFKCWLCEYDCSGFSYEEEDGYGIVFCLRCATTPHSFTYQAKEPHYLFYDAENRSACSACRRRRDREGSYICKDCDLVLDMRCATLPKNTRNKCDEHPLKLVFGESDDYPLHHWCDICEEKRDSKLWFYHCEVCDNAMHPECVFGKYPFIKLGSKYRYKHHSHPLTFVHKIDCHPICENCGKPCQDKTLECEEHGCNFVGHWECLRMPIYPLYSFHYLQ